MNVAARDIPATVDAGPDGCPAGLPPRSRACTAAAAAIPGEDALARRLRRLAARMASAMPDAPACEVAIFGTCPPGQAPTVLRAAGLLIGLALRQGPAWDGGAVVIVLETDPDGRTALRLAHGPVAPASVESAVVLDAVRRLAAAHGGALRLHRGAVTTTELILPPPAAACAPCAVAPPAGAPLDVRLARAERREVTVITLVFVALLAAMAMVTLCQAGGGSRGAGTARSICLGGMLLAGTRCPGPG